MTDESQNITPPTPSYFIDEGIPGVGDRPQWLPEKFKTVADMAKSYGELEKKFGTAPEAYDLSKSKHISQDYTPFQDLMNLAKDKRVPKEVMDKMVESFDSYIDTAYTIDYEAEVKKLGEGYDKQLEVLDNWTKANLSEASYKALAASLKTADGIKALEELRNKSMSNATIIPNGNDNSGASVPTVAEIQSEISANLTKYKTDPAYRKELQTRLEMAAKTSGVLDKTGH